MIKPNNITTKAKELNMYTCQYFTIKELVSPIVYKVWGEKAWMFFDEDVLKELDYIRETFGAPIVINNWATGGTLEQCGLRSNKDKLVMNKKTLYLSAHCLAKGFDLHSGYGNHRKLYDHIYDLIKSGKLKKFKRLENFNSTFTWVHADCFQANSIVFNP